MLEWTENPGAAGFGIEDYNLYKSRGFSDNDIRSFIEGNKQFFGAYNANVGDAVRSKLGLGDDYINYRTGRPQDEITAYAKGAYDRYLSNLQLQKERALREKELENLRAQRDQDTAGLRSELDAYKTKLGDYQNNFNEYQKQIDELKAKAANTEVIDSLKNSNKTLQDQLNTFQEQLKNRISSAVPLPNAPTAVDKALSRPVRRVFNPVSLYDSSRQLQYLNDKSALFDDIINDRVNTQWGSDWGFSA